MSGKVAQDEWRWVFGVSVLIVLVSSLPYAAGYLGQTHNLRFAGAVFDLEDYHSHLAKMWQGYRGEWRYRLLFTPEPHEGAYLQLFYVALGHLARVLGAELPLVYHMARVGCGFVVLPVTYRFIALFLPLPLRRTAFLLAGMASGLGWLVEAAAPSGPGGISPIDFWLIDAYLFFSIFTFPHFSLSTAALLGGFTFLLRHAPRPRMIDVALAVGAGWLLGLIHPYLLLVLDLVPALYFSLRAWRDRRWPVQEGLAMATLLVSQIPLLIYELWVFRMNPVFRAWSVQNRTFSPPPWHYVSGYGLVLGLALVGLRTFWKRSARASFPFIWLGLVGGLLCLPWGLQRRFLEGAHVALCLVAAWGLARLILRFGEAQSRRLSWCITALTVVLASVSNLYLVATYTLSAASRHPALFQTDDQVLAAKWLEVHSGWDDTVLSAYTTGNWIAGAIGHRVVLGHWAETVNYEEKRTQVSTFYAAGTPEPERLELLERWGACYVYVGPEERTLGDFDPNRTGSLVEVFRRGDVTIYEVQR